MSDDDGFGIVAEINMIPLIDVSLVLLIIFMVMTPYLVRSQIQVALPGAKSAPVQKEEPPLSVTITKDGQIYVAGKLVAADALEGELKPMLPGGEASAVVIEADKHTAFEHVVRVMDVSKKLGVSKMAVAVQKER